MNAIVAWLVLIVSTMFMIMGRADLGIWLLVMVIYAALFLVQPRKKRRE